MFVNNFMTIINGKEIADTILLEIKTEIEKLLNKPVLAVIQIGDKKESSIYIKKKREACELVGIKSQVINFDTNVTNDEICNQIDNLNNNTNINGILIQLPIPEYLNEVLVLGRINYLKDVDGFHPHNMGNLAMNDRIPPLIPCTPNGCLELLKREGVEIEGKHAVIVGKSNIVGLPMSLLLMKENATVTVCHDKTKNIKEHTMKADILITACGQPKMIKSDWIKSGVVIIDIGINPIKDNSKKNGYRLVGDVDFNDVQEKADKITPVPCGVGPMTVAMLLSNTLKAYKMQNNL